MVKMVSDHQKTRCLNGFIRYGGGHENGCHKFGSQLCFANVRSNRLIAFLEELIVGCSCPKY